MGKLYSSPLGNYSNQGTPGSFHVVKRERKPMPTCEIRWIDSHGNPTPDTNPAVCRVRTRDRVHQIGGRGVTFKASRWHFCCAEHAKQLTEPGMEIWECIPVEQETAT